MLEVPVVPELEDVEPTEVDEAPDPEVELTEVEVVEVVVPEVLDPEVVELDVEPPRVELAADVADDVFAEQAARSVSSRAEPTVRELMVRMIRPKGPQDRKGKGLCTGAPGDQSGCSTLPPSPASG